MPKLYSISISKDAQKALAKIPNPDYNKIVKDIQSLAVNPRPAGVKKLKGRIGYRIRHGNYRVIYTIDDDKIVVMIIDIGHRKDIYQ